MQSFLLQIKEYIQLTTTFTFTQTAFFTITLKSNNCTQTQLTCLRESNFGIVIFIQIFRI